MVLPCLRDHQHHGLGKRPPRHQQQFQGVVEIPGVGLIRLDHGKRLLQIIAEQRARESPFPGSHLVHVSAKRIDLAVVAHEAKGLRPIPAWERIGTEPRVNHCQVTPEVGVAQVFEVSEKLVRHQHAFVDNHAHREAADKERVIRVASRPAELVRCTFANHVQLPLELLRVHTVTCTDEHLLDFRLTLQGGGADHAVVGGDIPPPQNALPFFGHDLINPVDALPRALRIARQEYDACGVEPARRENDPQLFGGDLLQEILRQRGENSSAVTGVLVAPHGSPVGHVQENLFGVFDDRVALLSLYVCDESDTARLMLEARVVQSVLARSRSHLYSTPPGDKRPSFRAS